MIESPDPTAKNAQQRLHRMRQAIDKNDLLQVKQWILFEKQKKTVGAMSILAQSVKDFADIVHSLEMIQLLDEEGLRGLSRKTWGESMNSNIEMELRRNKNLAMEEYEKCLAWVLQKRFEYAYRGDLKSWVLGILHSKNDEKKWAQNIQKVKKAREAFETANKLSKFRGRMGSFLGEVLRSDWMATESKKSDFALWMSTVMRSASGNRESIESFKESVISMDVRKNIIIEDIRGQIRGEIEYEPSDVSIMAYMFGHDAFCEVPTLSEILCKDISAEQVSKWCVECIDRKNSKVERHWVVLRFEAWDPEKIDIKDKLEKQLLFWAGLYTEFHYHPPRARQVDGRASLKSKMQCIIKSLCSDEVSSEKCLGLMDVFEKSVGTVEDVERFEEYKALAQSMALKIRQGVQTKNVSRYAL